MCAPAPRSPPRAQPPRADDLGRGDWYNDIRLKSACSDVSKAFEWQRHRQSAVFVTFSTAEASLLATHRH